VSKWAIVLADDGRTPRARTLMLVDDKAEAEAIAADLAKRGVGVTVSAVTRP
jgi:hypothetical protein